MPDRMGLGSAMLDALRAQTLGGPQASSAGGGTLAAASFLTLALDAGLSAERVFTPGAGLSAVDGGANGAYTLGVDATVARSTWAVVAGAGLITGGNLSAGGVTLDVGAGTGITVNANDVAVNQNFAFAWTGLQTWSQLATFNAGARIAAGQQLQFGTDVAMGRKSADILQMATGDNIEASTYASGFQGWHISDTGDAEFNNISARGEFHTAVLVYGEVHATAGTFGVFKSAGKLRADLTTVTTPATASMDIEDPDVGHVQLFAVNDIVRLKDGSGADNWLKVTAVSNQTTFWRYTVDKQSGSNTTFRAGAAVADYGPSGAGLITMSADGTFGSSANLSIATHAGAPWSAQTLRVRLGNLNGSYGLAADTYGIGLGDYSGGNYLMYEPTGGFVLKAGNGAVSIDSGGVIVVADTVLGVYTSGKSYKFKDASGNTMGGLYAHSVSGPPVSEYVELRSLPIAGRRAELSLQALETNGTQNAHATLQALVGTGGISNTVIDLWATAAGASYATLSGGGGTLNGFLIGAATTPNAMLDVRGDGIFTGGLNIGSATGAATGSIKASGPIRAAAYTATDTGTGAANFILDRASTEFSEISFAGGVAVAFDLYRKASDDSLWMGTWNGAGANTDRYNFSTGGDLNLVSGVLKKGGTQVVGGRDTGYTNAWVTTAAEKAAARDAATITLVQLAQRVRALQESMVTHGLIGV